MPVKKRNYRFNGRHKGHFVRCWREGRGRRAECMVQVWAHAAEPSGEPDGDWAMPGVLPDDACISQAILQTDACRGDPS